MKLMIAVTSGLLLAMVQAPAQASDSDLFGRWSTDSEYLQLADGDDREDRRDERGRSDERQDKRDCRQDEGAVGKDKRDCKQEEVRDGARGNQGDRGPDKDNG